MIGWGRKLSYALAVVLIGCGLDLLGAGPPSTPIVDAGGPEAGPVDSGGGDIGPDVRACVSTPSGWSPVVLVAEGASCPAALGAATPFVEGPSSPSTTCACACGVHPGNPCTTRPFNMGWDTDDNGICLDATPTLAATGACQAVPNQQRFYRTSVGGLSGAPASGAACPDRPVLPPLTFARRGSVCQPTPGACLPPPAPTDMCLRHDGDVACPSDLGVKHLVAAATDVDDARTCGACGCAVLTCSSYGLSFYTDAACTQNQVNITLTGACSTPGVSTNHDYFRLQATPGPCTAGVSTSAVSGQATLRNAFTVCCRT
jgi:hypothetical protein